MRAYRPQKSPHSIGNDCNGLDRRAASRRRGLSLGAAHPVDRVEIHLVGHEAADLGSAEVEDVAEERVAATARPRRAVDGAFGHDDVIRFDEAGELEVWTIGTPRRHRSRRRMRFVR